MSTNKKEQPLTRQAYREQQRQSADDFEHRDQERVKVEREYSRTHRQAEADQPDKQPDEEATEPSSRSKITNTSDQRIHRLKQKLNLAIIGLILAIIIVYLVLFLVG